MRSLALNFACHSDRLELLINSFFLSFSLTNDYAADDDGDES